MTESKYGIFQTLIEKEYPNYEKKYRCDIFNDFVVEFHLVEKYLGEVIIFLHSEWFEIKNQIDKIIESSLNPRKFTFGFIQYFLDYFF